MNTSARPPPARPHGTLNLSSNFSTFGLDWGEDDAWDSTSDSESTIATARSTAVAVPKRPSANHSNSTLSFSYTHISAPSPSSYPPREDSLGALSKEAESKAGWTIVTRTNESTTKDPAFFSKRGFGTTKTPINIDPKYIDEEIDMVVGDLEQEPRLIARPANVIKDVADEIVKGLSSPPATTICAYSSPIDPFYNFRSLVNSKKVKALPQDPTELPATSSLQRELSIRASRRRKFDECLMSQDINIGVQSVLTENQIYLPITKLSYANLHGLAFPTSYDL